MGSANASTASAMTTPLCITLLVLLGVHHHATTTRQTDAIAQLQASYARLQTTYAALAAACAEPRPHAHARRRFADIRTFVKFTQLAYSGETPGAHAQAQAGGRSTLTALRRLPAAAPPAGAGG